MKRTKLIFGFLAILFTTHQAFGVINFQEEPEIVETPQSEVRIDRFVQIGIDLGKLQMEIQQNVHPCIDLLARLNALEDQLLRGPTAADPEQISIMLDQIDAIRAELPCAAEEILVEEEIVDLMCEQPLMCGCASMGGGGGGGMHGGGLGLLGLAGLAGLAGLSDSDSPSDDVVSP